MPGPITRSALCVRSQARSLKAGANSEQAAFDLFSRQRGKALSTRRLLHVELDKPFTTRVEVAKMLITTAPSRVGLPQTFSR